MANFLSFSYSGIGGIGQKFSNRYLDYVSVAFCSPANLVTWFCDGFHEGYFPEN